MTAVVQFDRVSRRYPGPPETIALRECSLTVDEGEFVTVVGPSGSGKSTLLNIMGLLDDPTEGEYRFLGKSMTSLRENKRATIRGANIGFVFQAFHLMEQRSCVENIMLADLYTGKSEKESRERAMAALEAVGLEDRSESLPTELSGGQQQRIAIARALAAQPALLLCDEPTGNLDSVTSETILSLFDQLNADGKTIVLITHDSDVAERGNRTVEMLDGSLRVSPPRSPTSMHEGEHEA